MGKKLRKASIIDVFCALWLTEEELLDRRNYYPALKAFVIIEKAANLGRDLCRQLWG